MFRILSGYWTCRIQVHSTADLESDYPNEIQDASTEMTVTLLSGKQFALDQSSEPHKFLQIRRTRFARHMISQADCANRIADGLSGVPNTNGLPTNRGSFLASLTIVDSSLRIACPENETSLEDSI